tara:strand:+ start:1221 stop:1490 length:270 start_codon:yes stop_codon:yes gene_type:complete
MFECPLCRKEWCVISKLCDKGCNDIRHLISIYGLENVLNVLKVNMVRPQEKLDEVCNGIMKKNDGYKNTKTSEISITKNSLRKKDDDKI